MTLYFTNGTIIPENKMASAIAQNLKAQTFSERCTVEVDISEQGKPQSNKEYHYYSFISQVLFLLSKTQHTFKSSYANIIIK